jgi:cytochrome c biogenesis protein CcmG/thiol:disulfide interchange protein DsbE
MNPLACRSCRILALAAALGALGAWAAPRGDDDAPKPAAKKPEGDATSEAKFYEKLDKEDREALKASVGFLVAKPTDTLVWLGGDAMDREAFRGKVTVIQSVGGKASARAALEKAKKSLPEGAVLLGLHTPDQAGRGEDSLKGNPPCIVAIDADGAWCDALGVWKKPVNIVIDKAGVVRFAGLTEAGLKAKVSLLMAEEVDDSVQGRERPAPAGAPEAKPAEDVKWPEFLAPVSGGSDMRGKKVPAFNVEKWLTARPDPGKRLVAMDFWATWCPPCRASIPHLNELHQKFGDDILFVGISDEKEPAYNQGLKKYKLKPADFRYSLALDSKSTMKGFFQISGIPHMAIFSPDGIVRWQGHPMSLQEEDIQKLVAANRANSKSAPGTGGGRGWVASGAGQKSR